MKGENDRMDKNNMPPDLRSQGHKNTSFDSVFQLLYLFVDEPLGVFVKVFRICSEIDVYFPILEWRTDGSI
jgi:hypothetical protein